MTIIVRTDIVGTYKYVRNIYADHFDKNLLTKTQIWPELRRQPKRRRFLRRDNPKSARLKAD